MCPTPLTIDVSLGERSYPIHIGGGVLTEAAGLLAARLPGKHVVIVHDAALTHSHLPTLQRALETGGFRCDMVCIPSGEGSKRFQQLETLCDRLLSFHPTRKTAIVALGGGVVGDLAGFAAAILMRGVPFVQAPTTLLAQVDSSVGGKTGINTRQGKNLIGAFYQPQAVLIDTDTLTTLPRRELLAGYAEIVKYGLINDAPFFEWLEQHGQALLDGDTTLRREAIARSCAAKARVVAADEHEQGQRALLNLGHTFGHALETACGHSATLLHGEAVAIGMVMAFQLSAQLGLCSETEAVRVSAHLKRVGLPVSPRDIRSDWEVDALMQTMRHDKKNTDAVITLILARGVGQSFISRETSESIISKFWQHITGEPHATSL